MRVVLFDGANETFYSADGDNLMDTLREVSFEMDKEYGETSPSDDDALRYAFYLSPTNDPTIHIGLNEAVITPGSTFILWNNGRQNAPEGVVIG